MSADFDRKNLVTPTVEFTKDGVRVGGAKQAPSNARDVRSEFSECLVKKFFWTDQAGNDLENPPGIPTGSNDFHVENTAFITRFFWTKDTIFLSEETVPPGANDFHFFFKRV